VLATVLIAAVVAGVSSANAATQSECQAQLAQLRADTVAAETSFRNAKDFTGAVGKVDAVARELDKGKYADAVTKLGDFQKLLAQLAGADKPKLDPATAAALSAEAQGVIDCINSIETA
jgi:FIMAH domain